MIVNYIEGDDNNDQEYVKNVLSAALKTKLEEIEELRKQDEKDKKKFEKMKKREKELYKREKFGRIDENGVKKRRQTLTEQETNWTFKNIHSEIGAIASKRVSGRLNNVEMTLFKSVGLGFQDLAISELVLDRYDS